MNAIHLGRSDLVFHLLVPAQAIQTISTIKMSGKRLLQLINDILDAAKMKQGGLVIKHEQVGEGRGDVHAWSGRGKAEWEAGQAEGSAPHCEAIVDTCMMDVAMNDDGGCTKRSPLVSRTHA